MWGDSPADIVDNALAIIYDTPYDNDSYFGVISVDEIWDDPIIKDALEKAAVVFEEDIGRPPTEEELRGGLAFSLGAPNATHLGG